MLSTLEYELISWTGLSALVISLATTNRIQGKEMCGNTEKRKDPSMGNWGNSYSTFTEFLSSLVY